MNPETISQIRNDEILREWFIKLSDMIGGELDEKSTLADGFDWFGALDDETLAQIRNLGKARFGPDNHAIREFLDLGFQLMTELERRKRT